jgi:monoamine oxidase
MQRNYTRRRFLAASGAVAAAGFAGRALAAPERVDVAVIGAGLSGLNAAMILQELGANVLVLEAEQRSGGRCLTKDRWHLQPDLGGAQIGKDYARVLDVSKRLGVKLGPGAHINAPYSFVLDGQLVPATEWPRSPLNRLVGPEREVPPHALGGYYVERRTPFTTVDAWLAPEAAKYDVSLAEWLETQGASPEARRLIRESQGVAPERVAVLRMLQEATRGRASLAQVSEAELRGKDAYERAALLSYHVVGGTSRLTDAMAATLGDRVRLGRRVAAIDLKAHGGTVRCADGTVVQARFVLAAVPFSVLRHVAITPALRGDQAEAVARMPYGNQSQVWLRVKAPYWEKDGIEASMWTDGPFNLIRQQLESDGSRELISALAFTDKAKRLDAMPEAERGRFAIDYIERVRPSTKGLLEFVGAHSWELAPHSRGCSHQYVPGRVMAWQQAMGQPHLGLHFAGEHLRRLEVGMESAMESGERAAREIAERLTA